jgi:16S rRNA (adenine1518-N6/adenine1519-N6)-dimethyltransferase
VSRPKKSLGQNFLHDANIARKIVRSLDLLPSDDVLEIGPGKGALTALILQEVKHCTAVELDDELVQELRNAFGASLTIIHGDVLDVNLRSIAGGKQWRIVGNIPYNITSPILFLIFDSADVVKDCTLMMQREVAQRLVAVPRTKEYGILSVFAQYYSTPKMLFTVSPKSFFPIPDVTSAVVSLSFQKRGVLTAFSNDVFRAVVRGVFGQRRKTLRNGLKSMKIPGTVLRSLSIDLAKRPEELTVEEFVKLSDQIAPFGTVLEENPLAYKPALS